MACFTVPVVEAIAVKVAEKQIEKKEIDAPKEAEILHENETKIPMSTKLRWLSRMLFGGSVLLAFEHVWHGEIVPWFPFLTAMSDPGDMMEMFHEMATVGVSMAVLVTAVWGVMCMVADSIVKRPESDGIKKGMMI